MRLVGIVMWAFAFTIVGCSATASDTEGSTPESDSESLSLGRLCKGPGNLSCPKGQYCAALGTAAGHCPTSSMFGSCASEPQICSDLFAPVCGCDGETYSNSCFAAAAGAAVDHSGACAPKSPQCGGIAGIPCAGFGKCVDDPTDQCDPERGGADCGGICSCIQNVACRVGTRFNSDPKVCACVPIVGGCTPCPPGKICPLICRATE